MRFDRNPETGDGVRPRILSVVLMAVVGSFLFRGITRSGSSSGGHAAVERRMDRVDQAGIEELHRKDVAATLASDPKLLAERRRSAAAGWAGGGWIDCDPRERPK